MKNFITKDQNSQIFSGSSNYVPNTEITDFRQLLKKCAFLENKSRNFKIEFSLHVA